MDIEKKVKETIKKYNMFSKRDKVLVALSGGKDSTSILFILKKFGYKVEGIMINLHLGEWSEIHKKNMKNFCKENKIPFHLVDLKKETGHGICFIKSVLKKEKNLTGCTVCGIIKRWVLNRWAKKLKADVLVTGHNLDDECQTILMNFLKGNILLGINSYPVTGGRKVEGFVQRVKPFFFVPEDEIKKYSLKKGFKILYDRCPCAIGTYRVETRDWLKDISNKEKLLIVQNWLKILPHLRKQKNYEVKKCKICGDPSRGDICKACEIFNTF
ncbi:MAG: TIGR00269 family protein [Candidatus Pacearchaeota archaeon]